MSAPTSAFGGKADGDARSYGDAGILVASRLMLAALGYTWGCGGHGSPRRLRRAGRGAISGPDPAPPGCLEP